MTQPNDLPNDPDVNVDEIIRLIVQERQGVVPPGTVTIPMLRAALNKQRQQFGKAPAAKPAEAPKRSKQTVVVPADDDDFSF